MSVYLYIRQSIRLPIDLTIHFSLYSSINLYSSLSAHPSMDSFIHSFFYLLSTHLSIHRPSHSSNRILLTPFTHQFINRSFIHPYTYQLIHPSTSPPNAPTTHPPLHQLPTQPSTYRSTYPPIHSPINSLTYPFIHASICRQPLPGQHWRQPVWPCTRDCNQGDGDS